MLNESYSQKITVVLKNLLIHISRTKKILHIIDKKKETDVWEV